MPGGFIPTSVATGDFNGDGKMDFVVANGGDNNLWLYFGNGDGTFKLPIILPITLGQTPTWVATADLRGNGKTDLIVAETDSASIGVFLGNGDGTFTETSVALPASANSLAVGDFNHDGKLDIAAPISDFNSSDYIVTLAGKGDGTFGTPIVTPASLYAPQTFWVSSADLNGDGIPDLVLTNQAVVEISMQVYLSNGDGTFSAGEAFPAPTAGPYQSVAIFDGDEDGKLDIVATDSVTGLWFFHGNGDGTFATNPVKSINGDFSYGIGVADLNGDGHLDVVTSGVFVGQQPGYGADAGNLTSVLFGDGKGHFGPPSVYAGDLSGYSLAVADFNGDGHPDVVTANQDSDSAVGDGNLDIAVFQSQPTTPNPTTFVQFLLGNGDGTFTPTFSSFSSPSNIPTLAIDANGDGKDDLFELNGLSSSFDVIPVTAGPSFQFAINGDPVVGREESATLTLAVPSSGSTTIALSASDPAITVPATVTIPVGQVSQSFTFDVGPALNDNHVFALTAQLGSQTAVAYGTRVSGGAKGFTVSPLFDPLLDGQVSVINLAGGQASDSYIVNVVSGNGYEGTLNLECLGLPGQSQCQFAPGVVLLPPGQGAQSRVVVTVPAGTAMGSYPFTLRATDGTLNYDLQLTLNVGDFTLSLSPSVQVAFPSDAASYTLTLTSVDNYQSLVSLTCTGLPAGASCPSPFASGPQPGGAVLPFSISTQSVATGNYPFTITGVSSPLSHSVNGTLQVWDFSPSVTPLSATVSAGGSATFTVKISSVNGFNGSVNLWCQNQANEAAKDQQTESKCSNKCYSNCSSICSHTHTQP